MRLAQLYFYVRRIYGKHLLPDLHSNRVRG